MNPRDSQKLPHGKLLLVGTLCALAGFASGLLAQPTARSHVVPIEAAKFVPVDPARPAGPAIAVLWGDPDKGPSSMLLKFGKNAGRLHLHSSDYHLVVLQGTMKHWIEGEQEAQATSVGPGSYWHQPGGQAHADSCLTEECVMFVKWEGKRDTMLPAASK